MDGFANLEHGCPDAWKDDRREFLGEGIDETREKIKSGEYVLVDLN